MLWTGFRVAAWRTGHL